MNTMVWNRRIMRISLDSYILREVEYEDGKPMRWRENTTMEASDVRGGFRRWVRQIEDAIDRPILKEVNGKLVQDDGIWLSVDGARK